MRYLRVAQKNEFVITLRRFFLESNLCWARIFIRSCFHFNGWKESLLMGKYTKKKLVVQGKYQQNRVAGGIPHSLLEYILRPGDRYVSYVVHNKFYCYFYLGLPE